ncbi:hypothetical protein RFI_05911 [Reticulomyxa filosa]|uniref:Uncharacterized protein n=1 Tax=Reticulomyxa filosa TaxID=46433 RepID=X6NZ97_RETFI|nr:hypothetical protein RFI_05911 [Reticulomyxa filosa]|eukprot:ETO31208.1 hypothetical protein RFI_05911 [Reticulomyxa filosa]
MGTQKPSEREIKQKTAHSTLSQCVLHKHEIIICGCYYNDDCSYHTIKNEYKFICEYPSHVTLDGQFIVKLIDNNSKHSNQITLLTFESLSFEEKFMKRKDYQLNVMKITIIFNFINYLFLIILQHLWICMCVSMMSPCFLVDVVGMVLLFQNIAQVFNSRRHFTRSIVLLCCNINYRYDFCFYFIFIDFCKFLKNLSICVCSKNIH